MKLTFYLTEVNSELSVLRIQYGKQAEFVNELENKLAEAEKKHREQQQQQQKQLQQQQERSGTPDSSNSFYDSYSRPRSTRLPRTSTNGSLSSSSNPVKMVQEMVGRVRVNILHSYDQQIIYIYINLLNIELRSKTTIMPFTGYSTFEPTPFL